MSVEQIYGGFLGLTLALGAVLAWAGLPVRWHIRLDDRVEPYLDRAPRRSRLLDLDDPSPRSLEEVLGPVLGRAAAQLDRLLGGTESVCSRLHRAGLAPDVERFRVTQLLWGLASSVIVSALGALLWWTRGASLVALAVVVTSALVFGATLCDWRLSQRAAARERRIIAEFPALADLLALSVTAGESPSQALERVARLSSGDLAAELDLCLAQARQGASLPEALGGLGERTGLPPLVRFVDGLVVAIERGTPLGDVLRAQAADARESARQGLIEEGGKREIHMMIPVVFLVLPVTVLFAVFPGVSMLRVAL